MVEADIVAKGNVDLWIQLLVPLLPGQSLERVSLLLLALKLLHLDFLLDIRLIFIHEIVRGIGPVILLKESVFSFGRGIEGHELLVDGLAALREGLLARLLPIDHLVLPLGHNLLEQFYVCDHWLSRGDNVARKPSIQTIILLFHDAAAHVLLDRGPIMKQILKLVISGPLDLLHRPPLVLKQAAAHRPRLP